MVGLWTFLLLVLLAAGSESHTLPLSRLASAPQRTPLPVLHSQISTRRFATTDPDCCDSINNAAELVASNNAEVSRELASWEVCLCGALATATGDFALHPVDTIKITQQAASGVASGVFATAHDIIRRNGLRGLYSGLLPYLVADGLSGAIKFASFEAGKTFLQKKLPEKYHGLSKFLSAAIAMLACSIVLVPGEVIKTRLQAGVVSYSLLLLL